MLVTQAQELTKLYFPEQTPKQNTKIKKNELMNRGMAYLKSKLSQSKQNTKVSLLLSQLPDKLQTKWQQLLEKNNTLGKTSLDFQSIMSKMTQILENDALDGKAKKTAIENLRKELGLKKSDMKKFFTAPLSAAYQDQYKSMQKDFDEEHSRLETQIQTAENQLGAFAPEVLDLKSQLNTLKTEMTPKIETAQTNYKTTKSMYKGGFWSKIGGFFKKVGSTIKTGLKKASSFVGKISGFFKKALDFALPFVQFIPVIGPALSAGMQAGEKILNSTDKILDRIPD